MALFGKELFPLLTVCPPCERYIFSYFPFEPRHEKTGFLHYAKTKAQISCAVTAQLISAFVFATQIVQSFFFLNTKYQASSYLL